MGGDGGDSPWDDEAIEGEPGLRLIQLRVGGRGRHIHSPLQLVPLQDVHVDPATWRTDFDLWVHLLSRFGQHSWIL